MGAAMPSKIYLMEKILDNLTAHTLGVSEMVNLLVLGILKAWFAKYLYG